ncbi:MAG: hypothetical protein ACTSRX_03850 [Promethearchaeota archaeon]
MKKPFFLLAVLLFLISISTIAALTTNDSPIFLEGHDCVGYHNDTYVKSSSQLNYGGAAHPGEKLEFSIDFGIKANGMIFNATVEIDNFPEDLTLHESQTFQNKPEMNSDSFTATWKISGNTVGNFTFSIKSLVSVNYTLYHTNYMATYEYRHTGSFEVSENPLEPPYLLANSPDEDINDTPLNWKIVLGQILGFFSIILVYLCIQLGIPERRTLIRKKMGWSAKQLRDTHCDLGYLATASVILHNIILSQSSLWELYFKWYQFYPTLYVSKIGWNVLSVGLDLAVLGSLIFIIATIAGAFFKQIARKFGYRTAVFTQQISYIAFIFSIIHSILNGSWTIEFPILLIIQIWMLIEVLVSSLVAISRSRNINKKKKTTLDLVNTPDQITIENSQDDINRSQ